MDGIWTSIWTEVLDPTLKKVFPEFSISPSGSYLGYTGDGVTCEDVDECSALYGENACDKGANSECKNLDGSYQCICKEGYIPTSYD